MELTLLNCRGCSSQKRTAWIMMRKPGKCVESQVRWIRYYLLSKNSRMESMRQLKAGRLWVDLSNRVWTRIAGRVAGMVEIA